MEGEFSDGWSEFEGSEGVLCRLRLVVHSNCDIGMVGGCACLLCLLVMRFSMSSFVEAIECIGVVGLQHIQHKKVKGKIIKRESLCGEAAETATKV